MEDKLRVLGEQTALIYLIDYGVTCPADPDGIRDRAGLFCNRGQFPFAIQMDALFFPNERGRISLMVHELIIASSVLQGVPVVGTAQAMHAMRWAKAPKSHCSFRALSCGLLLFPAGQDF